MTKKNDQDSMDLGTKLNNEIYKAEGFIEQNKKTLLIVFGALVVVVGGYFGYKSLVLGPQEKEAQEALYIVQRQFAMDSFSLVINGNGTDMSAVEIADEYGMTKAGNLAKYMAGMSYLKTGQYQEALDYLKDFDGNDLIVTPLAIGATGDAYSELGDYSNAASYYMKAANKNKNNLSTPLFLKKAGLTYEKLEEYNKAIDCYTRIKEDFRTSEQFVEIDKYIYRAKARAGEID